MPDKKPNIVFVFSDQQRYDTMAAYGADYMKVPHLNQLAQESFIFKNAYVSQPVCTPARATIMSGLYPHTAGPKKTKWLHIWRKKRANSLMKTKIDLLYSM